MHPSLVLCSPQLFPKPCMDWLPVRHQTRVLSASILGCSCLLSAKCRLTWCLGMLPSSSTFNCSFFFSPSSGNLQELASWSLKDSTLPSPSLCSHSPLAISAVCKVSRAYISIRLPLQLLKKKKSSHTYFPKVLWMSCQHLQFKTCTTINSV